VSRCGLGYCHRTVWMESLHWQIDADVGGTWVGGGRERLAWTGHCRVLRHLRADSEAGVFHLLTGMPSLGLMRRL
jgi:hypothetical protein